MTPWTLTGIEQAIRASWDRDTCADDDLPDWRPGNPARGHCAVTALVVHDLFGGELVLGEVHVGGVKTGHHWWNRLPGEAEAEVDLTREQFDTTEVVTRLRTVRRPPGTQHRYRKQYELFSARVLARLTETAGAPVRSRT